MKKNAYWIFVTHGIKEEFGSKKTDNRWPIFAHTHHKKCLAKGDRVVFYLAGKGFKKFIGSAEIDSSLRDDDDGINHYVLLKHVNHWKKPVKIKTVLDKLEFIENKSKWGMYFQSGVRPMAEKDYSLLISPHET